MIRTSAVADFDCRHCIRKVDYVFTFRTFFANVIKTSKNMFKYKSQLYDLGTSCITGVKILENLTCPRTTKPKILLVRI